jgi:hypothetical protein
LFSARDDSGAAVVTWRELAAPVSGVGREGGPVIQSGRVRVGRDGRVELTHVERPADRSAVSGAAYRRGRAYTSDAWGDGCERALATEAKGSLTSLSLLCQPRAAGGPRHARVTAATIAAPGSLDGCNVFIETPADSGASWTAYTSDDGRRLGSARLEPGAWNAAAVNSTMYYLTDGGGGTARARTTLHAVDLQSGATRWQTAVRGPSAPRP